VIVAVTYMPKAKLPPIRTIRSKPQVPDGHTKPPISHERKKRAEAETLPPPPSLDSPPQDSTSPRVSTRVKADRTAVTVDEVTADLSKDPRREK
jgi:hypothetical protein